MAYCFITLGLVSTALAGTLPHSFSKRDTFNWGSIGDSWTSGVAYSDDNAWDNNAGSKLEHERFCDLAEVIDRLPAVEGRMECSIGV